MSHQYFPGLCAWARLIIPFITMRTIEAYSSLATPSSTESSGRTEFQTFIILYTNAINEHNSINCSSPFLSGETLQLWTAPSGVQIMTSRNDTINPYGNKLRSKEVWVELTLDNSLVFHNPDDSVSGPYTCLILANDKDVFQTTVWVHVLKKSFFDTTRRLRVACLTSGIFLVMLVGSCVCYWRRTKKAGYSLARRQDDLFEIPQIMIEQSD